MPQFSAKTKDLRETSKHGCDSTAILPLDLFSLFNIHKIEERHLSEAGFTTAFPKLGRKIFCRNVEDLYKMCWAVKSPSALKWFGLKTTLQNSSSCSTIQIQQQQNNCRKREIRNRWFRFRFTCWYFCMWCQTTVSSAQQLPFTFLYELQHVIIAFSIVTLVSVSAIVQ